MSRSDLMLRAGYNLGEWNDIVGETFTGGVVDANSRRFRGELERCRIDALQLVHVRADSSKVSRWPSGGTRPSSGTLLLHLQSDGCSINHQSGQSTRADRGEAVLCDPDRSYTVDFHESYEMFVIELPVVAVLAREPGFDLDRFAGHKVEPHRSQLLLAFLQSAWLQRDSLANDADWRECVSRNVLDLAIRAICKAGGHEVIGVSAELRRAVIEYIKTNLPDPSLRTSSIAAALRVSARSVQNVFERRGTTTSAFILQQRLAVAAERLIGEPDRRSITELALDCGFSDSGYFARCFSRHFGVPPREYRRRGCGLNIR